VDGPLLRMNSGDNPGRDGKGRCGYQDPDNDLHGPLFTGPGL